MRSGTFSLALAAIVISMPTNASAQLFDSLKSALPTVLEGGLPCAGTAALVAKLAGKKDESQWAALGSGVLCAMAAVSAEQARQEALEQEQKLDNQISVQNNLNAELSRENVKLESELQELQQKAKILRNQKYENEQEAFRIGHELKSNAETAKERKDIVLSRKKTIELEIKSGLLTKNELEIKKNMKNNLDKRISLLDKIIALGNIS